MGSWIFRNTIVCGFFFIFSTLCYAQPGEDTCFDHATLIEVAPSNLTFDMACDDIGIAYVSGITGSIHETAYEGDSIYNEFYYYKLFRQFLNGVDRREAGEDMISSMAPLFVAQSSFIGGDLALSGTARQEIDNERKKLYVAFVLYKYAQNSPLQKYNLDIIQLKLAALTRAYPLTGNQLDCFILADIPTLPIETVFNSLSYLSCLSSNS
ncbi:MAG: hypothetical protein COB08_016930 [Rhodobacteraceae bacterium]|nr:hypothetical protein [Paracoccaceae bacterium]